MFYSHEILTNRKHGVATVWLVATLGSRSTLKKVSRKAILDVDVPKACETITDADAPMALRLQGSLLFGVSKVFSQQCGYVLSDMQGLRDKMRGVSMVMRDLQIDNAVVLTNDQLNLQTDPGFDVDANMGLDLSVFDMLSDTTERSSLLSPHSFASTQSSLLPIEEIGLQAPYVSAISPGIDPFDFDLDVDPLAGLLPTAERYIVPTGSIVEGPAIDENPAFEIGDDGGLVDMIDSGLDAQDDSFLNIVEPFAIQPEAGHTVHHGSAPGVIHQFLDDSTFNGDDVLFENDQPAPTTHGSSAPPANAAPDQVVSGPSAVAIDENNEIDTSVEAPQQRAKQARVLQPDQLTELSNRQLSEWNHNYLNTMAWASDEKSDRQSYGQARRNAAFWVLDQGIGGVTVNFGGDIESHPLSMFSGHALLDSLTGTVSTLAGRKRSLSAAAIEAEEAQVIRARETSPQSREILPTDEDSIFLQWDDDIEPEVGRQPASSLRDRASSSMPWNLAASSRQSSMREGLHVGIDSSVRHGFLSALSGRHPRLTSASPLMGRGTGAIDIDSPQYHGDQGSFDLSGGHDDFLDIVPGEVGEEFALERPVLGSDAQEAARGQQLAATLEHESYNFLAFLDEQITKGAEQDNSSPSITFEQLLPPAQNSNVVAAQGILHVLALATKGFISIEQEVAFGEIVLRIADDDQEAEDQGESPQIMT